MVPPSIRPVEIQCRSLRIRFLSSEGIRGSFPTSPVKYRYPCLLLTERSYRLLYGISR